MHPHPPPGAPRWDIADIFRTHGEAFRRAHPVSDEQRRAMWSIEHCRTQRLGGHLYQCQTCASTVPLYNSCLSRCCPTCQGPAQYKWMAQRTQRLLPTHYFHPVFTLPAALRPLAWRHQAVVFDLLFAAAAHTLIDLCRDPTQLGAAIGVTLVLHTWTRELTFHPHVHGILPGGGLDTAADRWVACAKEFLIHVAVLAAVFRGKFLAGLQQAYAHGAFPADTTLDRTHFRTLLGRAWLSRAASSRCAHHPKLARQFAMPRPQHVAHTRSPSPRRQVRRTLSPLPTPLPAPTSAEQRSAKRVAPCLPA